MFFIGEEVVIGNKWLPVSSWRLAVGDWLADGCPGEGFSDTVAVDRVIPL